MKKKNIKNYKTLSETDKKVWNIAMSETIPLKKSDQTSAEYNLSKNSNINGSNRIEKALNLKLNLDEKLNIHFNNFVSNSRIINNFQFY